MDDETIGANVPSNTARSDDLSPHDEAAPDTTKLRDYTRTKLALVTYVRTVREIFKKQGNLRSEELCAELMVKLAEDRFTLAVLGQFKRGKSSLMNAIIGRDILPVGVLPLTSAITILKFGPKERLIIRRNDSLFPEELPVSALADYVTETANPGNRKKVKTATVEVPLPFLRRGLEFVDTPGVGSLIDANTATTYGFLPECDAVLFVTSMETPLSHTELEFLQDIRHYVHRIFFVLNKTDILTEAERREMLDFTVHSIRSVTMADAVRVFPVSARAGLAAKKARDASGFEKSGLKALEEALAVFLTDEKTITFLSMVARKLLHILREAKAVPDEPAIHNGKPISNSQPAGRSPKISTSMNAVEKDLETLCDSIQEGKPLLESSVSTIEIDAEAAAAPSPESGSGAVDFAKELRMRGCPICDHLAREASDFFAHWQYAISNDAAAQSGFAAELGFCPLHTWQLFSMSSPRGASIGHARLVERIARDLRALRSMPDAGKRVGALVRDSRTCRVCGLLRAAEESHVNKFAGFLQDLHGGEAYRKSQGLCLRHLGLLLSAAPNESSADFLLSHAAGRFEEASEDMSSFAMKHEALRRSLHNTDEEDAYLRAIIHLAGGRNVCIPWQEEGEI